MKSNSQNNKTLEKFIRSLHDELKLRIKLVKQKLSNQQLASMTIDYLRGKQTNKENILKSSNHNQLHSPNPPQSEKTHLQELQDELLTMKNKLALEDQLTAKFLRQITKDRIMDNTLRINNRDSNFNRFDSSYNAESDHSLTLNINKDSVLETSGSKIKLLAEPIKSSRMRSSRASNDQENQRQKSKTFAKLRQLEKLVFAGQKTTKSKGKKEGVNDGWNFIQSPSKKMVTQQNQNLKVIQSSLITQLSLLQKYKQVPSIETLIEKERVLMKKELSLKELDEKLSKKQLTINHKHSQALKKQKFIRLM